MKEEKEDGQRSFRLLDMYRRAQQGATLSKQELAQRYRVSDKTVQRDIEAMRVFLDRAQQDMTLTYDRRTGGYRLTAEGAHDLTAEEIFAISKILLESRPFPKARMESILRKLERRMPDKAGQERLENLLKKELFCYTEPRHGKDVTAALWQLAAAIEGQRVTRFWYKRLDGTQHERRVHPVALLFSEFYFYLIAYYADGSKSYPIVFRVDRMWDIAVEEEHFRIVHATRFKDGEFRKRVQFMYAGTLRRITFTYSGASLEAILDRLPTAKLISSSAGIHTLEAESYGVGCEMWLRTQGDAVKILSVKELE
jgi:hypothetical protein